MNHPAHLITRIVGRTKLLLTPFYILSVICFYYLASSMCGQDKLNPELWLASEVGKMVLSWALTITHCVLFCPSTKCFIDWPSFFGQDGWILASCLFCKFTDFNSVSIHKHAKKRTRLISRHPALTLGQ